MADVSREGPPVAPGEIEAEPLRPAVDVAAVLRALDPFWTRAINETKSLTADEDAEETGGPDKGR